MTTNAFLLDLGRCIGCQACVVACITGNELSPGQEYIHLSEYSQGTYPDVVGGFQNHRCYHCTDAACVAVCPTGALFKEDGLTRLDRSKCSGCGYCVEACPYDVPKMVDGLASKCDGCAETTAAGKTPWCVDTCPSKALEYGDRDVILAEAHRRADAMKARYPDAQVYGETEAGGLGMLVVTPALGCPTPISRKRAVRGLPGCADVIGLPTDPQTPALVGLWQGVVQPGAIGLTAATAVAAGLGAVISRRNHLQELKEIGEDLPIQVPGEEAS